MSDYSVVLITVPGHEEATRLAEGLVEEHLAACVNIVPVVESIYRWQGEIQHDKECLLICKTGDTRWSALKDWVLKNHSYDVPEIIRLPIAEGSDTYLQWIRDCLEK
jgi:periplasmic divalent cation tolerance protein